MGLACDHDHSDSRPGHAEVEQAIVSVEARCAAEGERMTAPRRRVLELLLAAGEPVKAYDLIARYGLDGQAAKPPTVYRALEFLERLGFAHRIESLNAYVPCRIDGQSHRAAFLICDCCGAAEEFEPDFTAQLAAAAKAGYQVSTITLEARGRCAACSAPASS